MVELRLLSMGPVAETKEPYHIAIARDGGSKEWAKLQVRYRITQGTPNWSDWEDVKLVEENHEL